MNNQGNPRTSFVVTSPIFSGGGDLNSINAAIGQAFLQYKQP
jgi:hypothetical protein